MTLHHDPSPLRLRFLQSARGIPTIEQRLRERREAEARECAAYIDSVIKPEAEAVQQKAKDDAARAVAWAIATMAAILVLALYVWAGIAIWKGYPR